MSDNTSTFALTRSSNYATPNLDLKQNYTPSGQTMSAHAGSSTTATATAATTITWSPGASSFGELAVVWVSWKPTTPGALTITSTGVGPWRLIASYNDAANTITSAVFYNSLVTNQAGSGTFTSTAAGDVIAVGTVYTGVDQQFPIDAAAGQGTAACGSPCNHSAPSVTTTQLNDLIVTHFSAACGTATATWTPPAGMTERNDVATTGTLSTEGDDVLQAAATATGAMTATVNCGAGVVGVADTVALRGRAMSCPVITYRASATNSATAVTTGLVLNVPAGIQNGDVMIAALSASAGTIVKPAAWTALVTTATQGLWYRIASSEPASYTWTNGAVSANWAGANDAYYGVDVNGITDVSGSSITGQTTAAVNWTSITIVNDNALNIAVSFENNNVDTIAPPASYTPRSAQGGAAYIRTSTRLITPAGATAPTSTDTNASKSWGAFQVALHPAQASFGTQTLPTYNNWTCKFSSDQWSAGQTIGPTSVVTNLYLDNAITPTFIAATQGGTSGALNTVQATRPAGTASGDILIAHFAIRGGTTTATANITQNPTGWTLIDRVDNGTNVSLLVYWKLAGAEAGPYVWNWTGTAQRAAINIEDWRNVDATAPIDAHVGSIDAGNATGQYFAPSITPSYEYSQRIAAGFVATTLGCSGGWYQYDAGATSSGSGATNNVSGNVSRSYVAGQGADFLQGPTGKITENCSASVTGAFHQLSLKSAAHTCTITGNLLHTYTPYYVSPTTTGVVNAGNLTINKPAVAGGVLANDVLIASVVFAGNPTITFTGTWTLVQRTNNATAPAMGVAVYRLLATGSDPASWTWTIGQNAAGAISVYRNVDPTTPVDVQNGQTTSAAAQTTPVIIATQPDELFVASLGIASTTSIGATNWAAAPAGMTERADVANTATNWVAIEQSDQLQTGAGKNSESNTATTGTSGVAHVLALKGKPATTIGSMSRAVASPRSAPTLFTDSINVGSTETFNANDRLEFDVVTPNDATNCGTAIYFDSSATLSRLTISTIVPERVAGLMLVAPLLPLAMEWWRRRRRA